MAATVVTLNPQHQALSIDGLRARLVKITFTASDYVTNGYSLTPNSFGLAEILGAVVVGTTTSNPTVRAQFNYNITTSKLQAYGAAGGATGLTEIANGGDLSASTVVLLVIGH